MKYIKGTLDCVLRYAANNEFRLYGYVDLDWEGSVEDRNRTSGFCFSLGLGVISWLSRNNMIVFLSTTDVEYIATCSTCSKEVWLHKLLEGVFDAKMDTIDIYYDNQSCIKLTEKSMFHYKSKHIDIKYHYILDMVQRGVMKL